jgi:hypothetical protein
MARLASASCVAGAGSSDASSASWSGPGNLGRGWMSRRGPEAERAGAGETRNEKRKGRFTGFPLFTESSVGSAQRSCGV